MSSGAAELLGVGPVAGKLQEEAALRSQDCRLPLSAPQHPPPALTLYCRQRLRPWGADLNPVSAICRPGLQDPYLKAQVFLYCLGTLNCDVCQVLQQCCDGSRMKGHVFLDVSSNFNP